MASDSERCVDELLRRVGAVEVLVTKLDGDKESEELVEEARQYLADSQAFIHNNKPLIPAYCLKKLADALKKLETTIDRPNKVQFKFSSSQKPKCSPQPTQTKADASQPPAANDEHKPSAVGFGFSQKSGETLELNGEQVESKDVSLVQLDKCQVKVRGFANTVYIRDLVDTSVEVCLACRAITVINCTRCHFKLACQQLRIDSTCSSQFEIFTSARSMLESSSGLTFKRLQVANLSDQTTVSSLFQRAGFVESANNWRLVDDFEWLVPNSASKNFQLIDDQ